MNADDSPENAAGLNDNTVTEFATYEDYLDSQIKPTDLYYLEVRQTSSRKYTSAHYYDSKLI